MSVEEKAGQVLVVDFTGVTVTPHAIKVVVTFSDAPQALRTAAKIIYGKRKASGKLPVRAGVT